MAASFVYSLVALACVVLIAPTIAASPNSLRLGAPVPSSPSITFYEDGNCTQKESTIYWFSPINTCRATQPLFNLSDRLDCNTDPQTNLTTFIWHSFSNDTQHDCFSNGTAVDFHVVQSIGMSGACVKVLYAGETTYGVVYCGAGSSFGPAPAPAPAPAAVQGDHKQSINKRLMSSMLPQGRKAQ